MSAPLTQIVVDGLLETIHSNRLRPGDALPSAADLCRRFNVSRTVIREALAEMAARGIILRGRGKETVLAEPGADQLTALMTFRMRQGRLALMDVQDFREGVEVQSARLAAQRRTQSDVRRLRRCFRDIEDALGDESFHDADVAFHRAIAVASGNPLVLLNIDAVAELGRESRIRATEGWRSDGRTLRPVIEAHRKILRAIEAGQSTRAASAMQQHLLQTREGLALAARRERAAT